MAGSRQRLVCRDCGHQTTVTAGTLFQGTRTPLRQWFAAAWLVATAEQGVSARQLARALNLGSYETAWTMLHRFRRAMVRSGRPRWRAGSRSDGAAPGRPTRRAGRGHGRHRPRGPGETPAGSACSGCLGRARRPGRLPGRVVEPGTLVRAVRLEPGGRWPSSAS